MHFKVGNEGFGFIAALKLWPLLDQTQTLTVGKIYCKAASLVFGVTQEKYNITLHWKQIQTIIIVSNRDIYNTYKHSSQSAAVSVSEKPDFMEKIELCKSTVYKVLICTNMCVSVLSRKHPEEEAAQYWTQVTV